MIGEVANPAEILLLAKKSSKIDPYPNNNTTTNGTGNNHRNKSKRIQLFLYIVYMLFIYKHLEIYFN